MDSFERSNEEKLPAEKYFYSSLKDGKIGDDGKISDGYISAKEMKWLSASFQHYVSPKLFWFKRYHVIFAPLTNTIPGTPEGIS